MVHGWLSGGFTGGSRWMMVNESSWFINNATGWSVVAHDKKTVLNAITNETQGQSPVISGSVDGTAGSYLTIATDSSRTIPSGRGRKPRQFSSDC